MSENTDDYRSDEADPALAPLNDPRHTAIHEAGHAVIARVLTLSSGLATIEADYADNAGGYSITDDPWECVRQWETRGRVRTSWNAVWYGRIMAYMAGAEAEVKILGATQGGDGDDRYQIELMSKEVKFRRHDWDHVEPRLRVMTRMLVRRHRARIERVADALLSEITLTGERIDKLAGRSVNDVTVNAPFLLEMYRLQQQSEC